VRDLWADFRCIRRVIRSIRAPVLAKMQPKRSIKLLVTYFLCSSTIIAVFFWQFSNLSFFANDNNEWVSIPGALLRSAYFDDRGRYSTIRVLAFRLKEITTSFEYMCVFVHNDLIVFAYAANSVTINSHDTLEPIYFECSIPNGTLCHTFVTILPRSDLKIRKIQSKLLPIQRKHVYKESSKEVVSCVSPLYNGASLTIRRYQVL
jgi:hypothetical protein